MTKLTQNEVAVLKGIDQSEYGEFLVDAVWTFSCTQHSGLKARSVPPVIASLLKKGMVTTAGNGTEQTPYEIQMTKAGIEAYITAVGKISVKKAPSWDTRTEFLAEQEQLKGNA